MKAKQPFWKKRPVPSTPVETAPQRPHADVLTEYEQCARDAGEIQFRITSFSALLQQINMKMAKLQEEASKMPAPAAPTEAPVPQAPEVTSPAAPVETDLN